MFGEARIIRSRPDRYVGQMLPIAELVLYGDPSTWRCAGCGCTQERACFIPGVGVCSWVAPNLCSGCAL